MKADLAASNFFNAEVEEEALKSFSKIIISRSSSLQATVLPIYSLLLAVKKIMDPPRKALPVSHKIEAESKFPLIF